MVRDLLKGFVREDWLAQVDFDSLERASGSYITDDLRERANDIVWRVRWGKRWVYIYLLIEFLCGAPHKNSYAKSPVMRMREHEVLVLRFGDGTLRLRDRRSNCA